MTVAQLEVMQLRAALDQILRECNSLKLSRARIVRIIVEALSSPEGANSSSD